MPFGRQFPQEIVTSAILALGRLGSVPRASRLYRSPAWPDAADPPFINAVAVLKTRLSPEALLAGFHGLEAAFGRRRKERNAPRTLDLDLIDYDGRICSAHDASGLILPHPGVASRDFVLAPLAEVAPAWRHPETGKTAVELLNALPTRTARPL